MVHTFRSKFFLLVCVVFIANSAAAQPRNEIDSLQRLLSSSKSPDTIRWNYLMQLAELYRDVQHDSALLYAQQALQMAQSSKDTAHLCLAYNKIGVIYTEKAAQELATQYFFKTLALVEGRDKWKKEQAKAYLNIAGAFWGSDNKKSLEYTLKCRAILETLPDTLLLAQNYHASGLLYVELEKLDSAILSYKKALKLYTLLKIDKGKGIVLRLIGDNYVAKKDYKVAIPFFEESAVIFASLGDDGQRVYNYISMSKCYLALNDYTKALYYLRQTQTIIRQHPEGYNVEVRALEERLAEVFAAQGQYDSAYVHQKKYQVLLDAANKVEISRQAEELETKYQTTQKEQENQLLRQQNELAQSRNYLYGSGLLFTLLLIGVGVFYIYSIRRKNTIIEQKNLALDESNQEMIALMAEKSHLTSLVTHDIQNPLSMIRFTTAELVREHQNRDMPTQDLAAIDLAAGQILDMSRRIMALEGMGENEMKVKTAPIQLASLLKEMLPLYEQWSKKKGVQIIMPNADQQTEILGDYFLVSRAIGNVLSNAIKFSKAGQRILLELQEKEDVIQLNIQDEGPGITAMEKEQLFQKSKKTSTSALLFESSTGTGLYLTKRYMKAMNGDVEANSEVGVGSIFTMQFKKADFLAAVA